MSHELDMSNGRANMAYVAGEVPWHGLGQALTAGASIETWTKEAGLNFNVERADVQFATKDNVYHNHGNRDVLFRGDTFAPLGIMSKGYKLVQPADIMAFFAELGEKGGFKIETAGALRGGAKVWALAKVGDAATIVPGDVVLPYLLLATSFDGSLATTGKFTVVRVVCQNTLTCALETQDKGGKTVRVPHSATFSPASVREKLGIAIDSWSAWLLEAKRLAAKPLSGTSADDFLTALLAKPRSAIEDIRESTGYRNIMVLFEGGATGSELTGGRSSWQMLNAVTEYVDHVKGNTADSRLNSAWFGNGDAMKSKAYVLLTAS